MPNISITPLLICYMLQNTLMCPHPFRIPISLSPPLSLLLFQRCTHPSSLKFYLSETQHVSISPLHSISQSHTLIDLKFTNSKTLTTHHLTVSSSSLLCLLSTTHDSYGPLHLFEFDDLQHQRPSSLSTATSLPFCRIALHRVSPHQPLRRIDGGFLFLFFKKKFKFQTLICMFFLVFFPGFFI